MLANLTKRLFPNKQGFVPARGNGVLRMNLIYLSFSLPMTGKPNDARKLDIYNRTVKFIRLVRKEGAIRQTSLEDIIALKLDPIYHRLEKKDYIDIAIFLGTFFFEEMLHFYREKFPMNEARIGA